MLLFVDSEVRNPSEAVLIHAFKTPLNHGKRKKKEKKSFFSLLTDVVDFTFISISNGVKDIGKNYPAAKLYAVPDLLRQKVFFRLATKLFSGQLRDLLQN